VTAKNGLAEVLERTKAIDHGFVAYKLGGIHVKVSNITEPSVEESLEHVWGFGEDPLTLET
jgi:hypothetical protein